ncbi:MAG: PSP1 domain-containing protein [Desulfobulbus sp.]|jgi:cell fate regulator YaaT (PSP1 superfamily)
MTLPHSGQEPDNHLPPEEREDEENLTRLYTVRFREQGQEHTAGAHLENLVPGDQVMVRTDHGPEPAVVLNRIGRPISDILQRPLHYRIQRLLENDERDQYERLPELERNAFRLCRRHIDRMGLPMHLVRVERFFSGARLIFYFTAESRVDFRELVKVLAQEFRTRIEMRQIGVRHETKMTGGLGICGRELCCSSFLNTFDSVSIKMAKAQDLPLNPAKISGLCNRLLCCLTYEYETYRTMKKGMPRVGRQILVDGRAYQVVRQIPLQGQVAVISGDGVERLLTEDEWRGAEAMPKPTPRKKSGEKTSRPHRGSQPKTVQDDRQND